MPAYNATPLYTYKLDVYNMVMPKINIWLPDEVYGAWLDDPNRKGVIAKVVADYYGFTVNRSRVVKKPTSS